MSIHDSHPHDDRFASLYAALLDNLATVLDLTAGADEATHPATYDILAADLAGELHLDAGVTAIIGGHTPPARPARGSVPATSSTPSVRLADQLKSFTDLERLRLRARPSYCGLRRVLALVPNLDLAYELACTLDHAHKLVHTYAHTRELAHDLARARDLAHALARARDLGYALDLAYARDLAHAQARDRAAARDRDRELTRDRDLARTLARDLERAHARAHAPVLALAPALARTLARTLARDLDLARARAHDLARNRDGILARTLDLARALAHDLDLDLDPDLTSTRITSVLEGLTEIADNFVGADLRAAVDFDATDWDGVRWSPATTWPPGWVGRVRAISVEIEPGIFQVVDGRRSFHEIST